MPSSPKRSARIRALKIVETLSLAGFTAYFAGGWVRDYLLGIDSTEIDIATSAHPEDVQRLFPKTIPVGVAFGVIIVVDEESTFEVATFRHDHPYIDGRHPEGVDFSSPKEDAQRRDFTINGMFYDPLRDLVIDYVEGQKDLDARIIRAIGDPQKRFEEDRLRMLRAVRFSHRFEFPIESNTEKALHHFAPSLLPAVSMERILQELKKMASFGNFPSALKKLFNLGLLQVIFPTWNQKFPLSLDNFSSSEIPAVITLMELFPTASLQEKLELCSYLKTSQKEIKAVTFFHHAKSASTPYDYAKIYADPLGPMWISTQPDPKIHQKRAVELSQHIKRLQKKTPLITANDLKNEGILPSPKMGVLLELAQEASVNKDFNSKKQVLDYLKQASLWHNR